MPSLLYVSGDPGLDIRWKLDYLSDICIICMKRLLYRFLIPHLRIDEKCFN